MSLDIYLTEGETTRAPCPHCDGTGTVSEFSGYKWSRNITHNLNRMAEAAGIYGVLWRPDEHGITKASQMIEPLTAGLALLRSDPDRFRKFDAPNGWGKYDDFVPWVARVLDECREHPNADVQASR